MYNAGDDKQVNKKKEESKNSRDQELEDIATILKTPAGIRFFRRFMAEGYIFKTTFTGNSQGFFLEGHRNFALKFFDDICEAAPNKISEIMIKQEEDSKDE